MIRVLGVATLCGLFALFGFIVGRRQRAAPAAAVVQPPAEPEAAVVSGRPRESTGRRVVCPQVTTTEVPPGRTSEEILSALHRLPSMITPERAPVEARVNSIEGYLLGVSLALQASGTSALKAMSDQFADEICSGSHRTDLDLMIFGRLAMIQPAVSSERALGCAFDGRKKEDVVLWTLLKAWNSTGRPVMPAIASIASEATDQRTKTLLLPPEEARQQLMEQLANGHRELEARLNAGANTLPGAATLSGTNTRPAPTTREVAASLR